MIHSKRRTVFSTVVVSLRNDDGVIFGISLSSMLALFPTAMLKTGNAAWTWNLGSACGCTIHPASNERPVRLAPITVAKHFVLVQSAADLSLAYHITNV